MDDSAFSDEDSQRFYTIENAETMNEFFMSMVSSGNHWMFISSRGALTAGRIAADHALFPYETVDKIMAGRGKNGTRSLIRLHGKGVSVVWEPYADWVQAFWRVKRSISKNFSGSTIRFVEDNLDLGLRFSWSWSFSHRRGFIRTASLENTGQECARIDLADGFLNIMNGGVSRRVQAELSCLSDAYKDNVYDERSGLAAFSLASLVSDKAEPREALSATLAWQLGLDEARVSLSRTSMDNFLRGEPGDFPARRTGMKSDFILHASFSLEPGQSRLWHIVADVDQDQRAAALLRAELAGDRRALARELSEAGRVMDEELIALLGAADGLSRSALAMHEWHHAANTMFNIMRGGVPERGMQLRSADTLRFIGKRNRKALPTATALLREGTMSHARFVELLDASTEPVLSRLAREYLPFTFSRRHGDPSRPWNEFSIRLHDKEGAPLVHYQGNWRDIFQNWEALGLSYPAYLESFLSIFLNATTLDGYNPYRVSQDGIDWERPEPENPWSNIGYWNDHQIIYFQKLAEALEARYPGRLASLLERRNYSWADVPYRIAPYADICANPRATIHFDKALDERIAMRVEDMGGDGRLVPGQDGTPLQSSLLEKLLALFSAKLGNLVPDGGVWLNTQRPEWNDANNALAGYGLSMVTVMYLRRFARFWLGILKSASAASSVLSASLAALVQEQLAALERFNDADPVKDAGGERRANARKRYMDEMGKALDAYRRRVYAYEGIEGREEFAAADLARYLEEALALIDATIANGKRSDGLYESYMLLSFSQDRQCAYVQSLYPMLEGQVAALSSGLLDARASLSLLDALQKSALYTPDRNSFLLYPERVLPDFFAKNACPPSLYTGSALARALVDGDCTGILYRDQGGVLRFGAGMANAHELAAALDALAIDKRWSELIRQGRDGLLAAYEECFKHASFTGRSGAMYAYEGLGSIYWHMIAKLLLAVMELRQGCAIEGADRRLVAGLDEAYMRIREGIGYRKTPEAWGAFPFDPYSHTPKHAKAQQPGMTGQVKEELLTRMGEMGIAVFKGRIMALPVSFLADEFLARDAEFSYYDTDFKPRKLALQSGELACTLCQTPFIRRKGAPAIRMQAILANGDSVEFSEALDERLSASIFAREGLVRAVYIHGGA
jgi:hypothetical protein